MMFSSCRKICLQRCVSSVPSLLRTRDCQLLTPLLGSSCGHGSLSISIRCKSSEIFASASDYFKIKLLPKLSSMSSLKASKKLLSSPKRSKQRKMREQPRNPDDAVAKLSEQLNSKWVINPRLQEHIRENVRTFSEKGLSDDRDTHFSVIFLGTGSNIPSKDRGCSATVLRLDVKQYYLVDAGEGTLLKITQSRVKVKQIEKIFITHMHGDHIMGLLSTLLYMQDSINDSKVEKDHVIKIYGPVGLYSYIAMNLSIMMAKFRHIQVEVYELTLPDQDQRNSIWNKPGWTDTCDSLQQNNLSRKSVLPDKDETGNFTDVWTLETPHEIKTPEDFENVRQSSRGVYIKASLLYHIPKMPCFGYVFTEPSTLPLSLDVNKAISLGLTMQKRFALLKCGFSVWNDDGTREIHPEEVTTVTLKPRKAAILGDCYYVPPPMLQLCQDADVLVHESTFSEDELGGDKKKINGRIRSGGHSSAAMAGLVAKAVGAKVLLLNHLGTSQQVNSELKRTGSEAEREAGDNTNVQVAYDFMEILVPRKGF